ncbi:hypothetical protein Ancab_003829 [Ancistrocladus abbreviatus]
MPCCYKTPSGTCSLSHNWNTISCPGARNMPAQPSLPLLLPLDGLRHFRPPVSAPSWIPDQNLEEQKQQLSTR